MVNWLPLSHDFGLVCGVLCPILLGARGVLLSPHQWVRRPSLLFEAIARHRGTMCWMPNFALNHCVRVVRPRDLEGIDLGSVRVLMGGAEPVRHESQQAFAERFAPHGFREESLCAGYGMAETTLAVTVTAVGERNRVDWIDGRALHATGKAIPVVPAEPGAVALVSGGRPLAGVEIRIVADDGERLPERAVGEVQVRGESMFSGYHRSPAATAAAVVDGWYATGDVGYWGEGELFVCGRRSDTIIVGGANVYPTDVEAIAIRHAEIKPNAVAAFGVEDQALGTQAVVLVAEARSGHVEHEHLARQLLAEVVAELGIRPADVRIVRRGWVVKTPNGKVSRAKCRDRYLDELDRTRSC
jgi:acyl-CoA synthetase (AMP-forming)/AMP-acid ligase II